MCAAWRYGMLFAAVTGACSVPPVTFTPEVVVVPDGGGPPDGGIGGPLTATITVGRNGGATGTVSAQGAAISCGASCSATVEIGTSVTLNAVPDPGGVFGGWAGGCSGVEATCVITVNQDIDVVATFDVTMFSVALEVVGSGSITSNTALACPGQCTGRFPYNTAIELNVEPAAGSTFVGWAGQCDGADPCSFNVTADTTVSAAFARNDELIVDLDGNGGGVVTSSPAGISCGDDCTERYPPGTRVSLSAAARGDSTFTGWEGQGCSGRGTCEFTMNSGVVVIATFALQRHALRVDLAGDGAGSVTSSPGGITCGTDCEESYDAHSIVRLTASSQPGSEFIGWSGGVACPGRGPCDVPMEAAVSVTASFVQTHFVVGVTRTGTGTGTVRSTPAGIDCGTDCSEEFARGSVVELRAVAERGSVFAGWQGDCAGTAPCQLTASRAMSVTARFELASGLFTINNDTDRLQRIDPITLAVTDIGPLNINVDTFIDCAWHPVDMTLYLTTATVLYRVNLATGEAVLVGSHGLGSMPALAHDPVSNTLYGVSNANSLFRLNPQTVVATLVGATGMPQIEGLAWDSTRNRMTAYSAIAQAVATINLTTGAATTVATVTGINNLGMTYDPGIDRFWVIDRVGVLHQLDPSASFSRTTILTGLGSHTCIASVPR